MKINVVTSWMVVCLLIMAGKKSLLMCKHGKIINRIIMWEWSRRVASWHPGADEMVDIPGGKMLMGTNAADGKDGEYPAKEVDVQPFKIDKCPVTNSEFR